MKLVAEMHIAPVLRRWMARLALAVIVAIAIGYLPAELLRRDPQAVKLQTQLEQLQQQASELIATNAQLLREIDALRTDVGAIEDHARSDLGMVYPDEVVLRVSEEPAR